MAKKKKQGGARSNAGRKPAEDPKIAVPVYLKSSVIDYHGGKELLKEKIIKFANAKKNE